MSAPLVICTNVITFPTFDDFYSKLKDLKFEFDPSALSLPTMPSPLFPTINSPDLYIANLATQLSISTFLNFIKAALQPMMNFLGMVLEFPVVPILNLTLDDLLNGFDMQALIQRLQDVLPNLTIPLLPDPLLLTISIPEYEIVEKIHALINAYCGNLITFAMGIINAVKDKLAVKPFKFIVDFPGIPEIPTSFEDLLALVYPLLGVENLQELIEKYKNKLNNLPSLSSLLMELEIPGLPDLNFIIPDPLFVDLSILEIEIIEISKNFYMSIMSACTMIIKRFCDKITNFISFTFPTICIPIPRLPNLPTLA